MPNTTNFNWATPADTDLVKDGAAAIRTLGSSIDSSFVDLKGGTTGQVLAKASGTDLDFSWVAQDDSNAIQNAIVDAKGDIIAATANDTPARLGVGANGTVLTADSTAATGLAWSPISAAGLNWSLLNAGGTALTGAATVTISSISNKEYILVLIDNASSANADSIIGLRINTDTGANYSNFGGLIAAAGSYLASNFTVNAGTTQTYQPIGRMAANAGSQVCGGAFITGGTNTGIKSIQSMGAGTASGSNQHRNYTLTGVYNGSAAITSISLFSDNGNFDAGTIFVYGA